MSSDIKKLCNKFSGMALSDIDIEDFNYLGYRIKYIYQTKEYIDDNPDYNYVLFYIDDEKTITFYDIFEYSEINHQGLGEYSLNIIKR